MGTDTKIDGADQAIIFFDGVCNLCNGAVQFIIKRDPGGYFKFASLQSEKASQVLSGYAVESSELESIILIMNSMVYDKSTAALKISSRLSGFWPILNIFWVIPRPLRDLVYDWIAKNRYKWFGKRDECMVPSDDLISRFVGV